MPITFFYLPKLQSPKTGNQLLSILSDFWWWSHFLGNKQTKNAKNQKSSKKRILNARLLKIFAARAKCDMRTRPIPKFYFLTSLIVFYSYICQWDYKTTESIFETFGFGNFDVFLMFSWGKRQNCQTQNFQKLILCFCI